MGATRNATSADVLNRLHSFLQLACVLIVCILGILAFRAYDAIFTTERERAIKSGVADARRQRAAECKKKAFVPDVFSDSLKLEAAESAAACIKEIR